RTRLPVRQDAVGPYHRKAGDGRDRFCNAAPVTERQTFGLVHADACEAVAPAGRVAGPEPIHSLLAIARDLLPGPAARRQRQVSRERGDAAWFDRAARLPRGQSDPGERFGRFEAPLCAVEFAPEIHIAAG